MNEKNLTAVKELENDLRQRLSLQNDEERFFSDLTGLFMDIIYEISQTDKNESAIIYDYAKLLEQRLQLYTGESAYIAGSEAWDKPLDDVTTAYLYSVLESENGRCLANRIQECFDKIKGLLGGKLSLLNDFTETYGRVHGIIKNNIHLFIDMGQKSETATE
jgi:hypothetical protein